MGGRGRCLRWVDEGAPRPPASDYILNAFMRRPPALGVTAGRIIPSCLLDRSQVRRHYWTPPVTAGPTRRTTTLVHLAWATPEARSTTPGANPLSCLRRMELRPAPGAMGPPGAVVVRGLARVPARHTALVDLGCGRRSPSIGCPATSNEPTGSEVAAEAGGTATSK